MIRRHARGARNRLDLNDRIQVRTVRKRLKISDRQLTKLVQTVGNSIAAVTKEANSRKSVALASELQSPAVVASAQNAGIVEEANVAASQPPATPPDGRCPINIQ
jgi:hypothetical protein